MRGFGLSKVLVLAAVICFVLAAFGIDVGKLDLIAIGLAFGFASQYAFSQPMRLLPARNAPEYSSSGAWLQKNARCWALTNAGPS